MKKSRLHKWLVVLALVVVLLPLLAMGAVNYVGRRYAREIDELLASLLEPEIPDLGLAMGGEVVKETPGQTTTEPTEPVSSPNPAPSTKEPTGVTTTPSTPRDEQTTIAPKEPTQGATTPPGGIAASDQQTAVAIFEQMNMAEKVAVVQTVAKFSTSEMLEYYKLYKQGDKEATANIKSRLKAKLTADDYEKIRQLAGKYR